jgi:hypothetical protein
MPSTLRRWHPDFDGGGAACGQTPDRTAAKPLPPVFQDIAIDFVDLSIVVDRIHAAFFRTSR